MREIGNLSIVLSIVSIVFITALVFFFISIKHDQKAFKIVAIVLGLCSLTLSSVPLIRCGNARDTQKQVSDYELYRYRGGEVCLSPSGNSFTFGYYPQSRVDGALATSLSNAMIEMASLDLEKLKDSNEISNYDVLKARLDAGDIAAAYSVMKKCADYAPFDGVVIEYDYDYYLCQYNGKTPTDYHYNNDDVIVQGGSFYYRFTDGTRIQNDYYWYAFEPVEWIIIAQDNQTWTAMSKHILDTHLFNYNDPAAPYSSSALREWLNGDFYNALFDNYFKLRNIGLTNDQLNKFCYSDVNDVRYTGAARYRTGENVYDYINIPDAFVLDEVSYDVLCGSDYSDYTDFAWVQNSGSLFYHNTDQCIPYFWTSSPGNSNIDDLNYIGIVGVLYNQSRSEDNLEEIVVYSTTELGIKPIININNPYGYNNPNDSGNGSQTPGPGQQTSMDEAEESLYYDLERYGFTYCGNIIPREILESELIILDSFDVPQVKETQWYYRLFDGDILCCDKYEFGYSSLVEFSTYANNIDIEFFYYAYDELFGWDSETSFLYEDKAEGHATVPYSGDINLEISFSYYKDGSFDLDISCTYMFDVSNASIDCSVVLEDEDVNINIDFDDVFDDLRKVYAIRLNVENDMTISIDTDRDYILYQGEHYYNNNESYSLNKGEYYLFLVRKNYQANYSTVSIEVSVSGNTSQNQGSGQQTEEVNLEQDFYDSLEVSDYSLYGTSFPGDLIGYELMCLGGFTVPQVNETQWYYKIPDGDIPYYKQYIIEYRSAVEFITYANNIDLDDFYNHYDALVEWDKDKSFLDEDECEGYVRYDYDEERDVEISFRYKKDEYFYLYISCIYKHYISYTIDDYITLEDVGVYINIDFNEGMDEFKKIYVLEIYVEKDMAISINSECNYIIFDCYTDMFYDNQESYLLNAGECRLFLIRKNNEEDCYDFLIELLG